jgi:hypothetical protein
VTLVDAHPQLADFVLRRENAASVVATAANDDKSAAYDIAIGSCATSAPVARAATMAASSESAT